MGSMKKSIALWLLLAALCGGGEMAWLSAASAQSASAQQGSGFMAQRQRLIAALQLDVRQQVKLDAITSEMLPKYLALSSLDKAERDPARAKLNGEAQQKVNAMLTPDQRATYELMQAQKAAGRKSDAPAKFASGVLGS
jgi:hypothetical protein